MKSTRRVIAAFVLLTSACNSQGDHSRADALSDLHASAPRRAKALELLLRDHPASLADHLLLAPELFTLVTGDYVPKEAPADHVLLLEPVVSGISEAPHLQAELDRLLAATAMGARDFALRLGDLWSAVFAKAGCDVVYQQVEILLRGERSGYRRSAFEWLSKHADFPFGDFPWSSPTAEALRVRRPIGPTPSEEALAAQARADQVRAWVRRR